MSLKSANIPERIIDAKTVDTHIPRRYLHANDNDDSPSFEPVAGVGLAPQKTEISHQYEKQAHLLLDEELALQGAVSGMHSGIYKEMHDVVSTVMSHIVSGNAFMYMSAEEVVAIQQEVASRVSKHYNGGTKDACENTVATQVIKTVSSGIKQRIHDKHSEEGRYSLHDGKHKRTAHEQATPHVSDIHLGDRIHDLMDHHMHLFPHHQ